MTGLLDLPDEILASILADFGPVEAIRIGETCQRFHAIVLCADNCWKHLFLKDRWIKSSCFYSFLPKIADKVELLEIQRRQVNAVFDFPEMRQVKCFEMTTVYEHEDLWEPRPVSSSFFEQIEKVFPSLESFKCLLPIKIDALSAVFHGLPKLKHLYLFGNTNLTGTTGEAFDALVPLDGELLGRLDTIEINGWYGLSDSVFEKLIQLIERPDEVHGFGMNVTFLGEESCTKFQLFTNLISLHVSAYEFMDRENWEEVLQLAVCAMDTLKNLKLCLPKCSEKSWRSFFENAAFKLESLAIQDHEGLSDGIFGLLALKQPDLKVLWVQSDKSGAQLKILAHPKITNQSVRILQSLENLEVFSLHLSGHVYMTPAYLDFVLESPNLPPLRYFSVKIFEDVNKVAFRVATDHADKLKQLKIRLGQNCAIQDDLFLEQKYDELLENYVLRVRQKYEFL